MTLGQVLKARRSSLGKTLRDVENLTGISNGYLSQLESDAVKQPSPKHLYKLASTYGLEYARLMELAGYVPAHHIGAALGEDNAETFRGIEELTEEDKRKIQQYIEDLRDARRVRRGSIIASAGDPESSEGGGSAAST